MFEVIPALCNMDSFKKVINTVGGGAAYDVMDRSV